MAWLAESGGGIVVGHGPFREEMEPPADGPAFYIRGFTGPHDRPWKIPARLERLPQEEFAARFPQGDPQMEWQAPDAGPFSAVFQEVMAAIRLGTFEKTVPVVVEKGRCADHRPIIGALLRRQAPLCAYGHVDGDGGFAGATPELLFTLEGRRLRTMALAGTARREDREVFAADEKEIREHEYVAQTLVSKLQGLGQPRRQPRGILDLGPIVHFQTFIDVELDQAQTPAGLIERLHPTPALGPLPRTEETLALLRGWRERLGCPAEFGAPFGLWHEGAFRAVVAIRGLWWSGTEVSLPAGCGIIEASRLVNEWRELRLKRESVKAFLQPAL